LRGSGGFAPHFPKPGANFIDERKEEVKKFSFHPERSEGSLIDSNEAFSRKIVVRTP
jgi:hypothetical protein